MPNAVKTSKSKPSLATKTSIQQDVAALSKSSTSSGSNVEASPNGKSVSPSSKPARHAPKAPKKATQSVVHEQPTGGSVFESKAGSDSNSSRDAKPAKSAKPIKPAKSAKLVRDSFTMPADEHSQIASLKARVFALGHPVKKSELIRGGFRALSAMPADELVTLIQSLPVLKLGRKKK